MAQKKNEQDKIQNQNGKKESSCPTQDKNTSVGSLDIWKAPPKISVNVDKLLQQARAISQQVQEKGLFRGALIKPKEKNVPIFANVSHQTRLDIRSKARRPIKVGIKGRGGREWAETWTLQVYAAHWLTWCNVSLMRQAVSWTQMWVQACMLVYSLN